jgi:hypothetical protein
MALTFRLASIPKMMSTTSEMTSANYWDHFVARIGIRRDKHLVAPGLYRLGSPKADSSVFVTANYSLSFDALRTSLHGLMLTSWCLIPKASTSGARPASTPLAHAN